MTASAAARSLVGLLAVSAAAAPCVTGASPLDRAVRRTTLAEVRAIVTALVSRVNEVHAAEGIQALALAGGVAANTELRATLAAWGHEHGVPVHLPERSYTTDNAAMIAWAGLLRHRHGAGTPVEAVQARSRWPLGS